MGTRSPLDRVAFGGRVASVWSALAERILGNARLYDWVQKAAGFEQLRNRVADALSQLEPGTLVDVGAGTASLYGAVPAEIEYVALDVDDRKLERIREKFPHVSTVAGTGTSLPFTDDAFDYSLCVDVSHHLDDREFEQLVDELARVTARKLVFVDALQTPRVVSRLLWSLDRGSNPRTLAVLRRGFETCFTFERFETFTIRHAYVMAVAVPHRGCRHRGDAGKPLTP